MSSSAGRGGWEYCTENGMAEGNRNARATRSASAWAASTSSSELSRLTWAVASAMACAMAARAVRMPSGGLCTIARPNNPSPAPATARCSTASAPADCPTAVTRSGSPPNASMLRRTHRSASSWSISPRFAARSPPSPR